MKSFLSSNSVPQAETCISFMFNLNKSSRNNRGCKDLVNISAYMLSIQDTSRVSLAYIKSTQDASKVDLAYMKPTQNYFLYYLLSKY